MAKKQSPWLSEANDVVELHKFLGFQGNEKFEDCPDGNIRELSVLDLETTGFRVGVDKIIEIGLRRAYFDHKNQTICSIGGAYSGLEDPKQKLSKVVQQVTGLDDQMLKGESIDWVKVEEFIQSSDIIIAHNAYFDRGFLDLQLDVSKEKIWGCSHSQVSWLDHGFTKTNLEILSAYHGFYYEAHRALNDADATIKLLSSGKENYFAEILEDARIKRSVVRVFNTKFEVKDLVKDRGYHWHGGDKNLDKHWWKKLNRAAVDPEEKWLADNVLSKYSTVEVKPLKAAQNFSRNF